MLALVRSLKLFMVGIHCQSEVSQLSLSTQFTIVTTVTTLQRHVLFPAENDQCRESSDSVQVIRQSKIKKNNDMLVVSFHAKNVRLEIFDLSRVHLSQSRKDTRHLGISHGFDPSSTYMFVLPWKRVTECGFNASR